MACSRPVAAHRAAAAAFLLAWCAQGAFAAQPPASPPPATPLGSTPAPEAQPRLEFVFEARVALGPAVVQGETGRGHRQYIPITGGSVAGPKFTGEVIPGGWDYQLRYGGGCSSLTADYFWRADDGAVIHILNEGLTCGGAAPGSGERMWMRPQFEAPKGPHEWLTRGTFVASLEMDRSGPPTQGGPPQLSGIRIKFYQIK